MLQQTVPLESQSGIELENIQCNIVSPLNPLHAHYISLRLFDAQVLSSLLKSLFAAPQLQIFFESCSENKPLACNIAFTAAGLQRFGLSEAIYQQFPLAYRQGMAFRASLTGDADTSAAENWQGFYGSGSADLMVAFYCADAQLIDQQVAQHLQVPGITILDREIGRSRLNQAGEAIEHFGFRDGISQPFLHVGKNQDGLVGGGRVVADSLWAPLAAGEFILGYENEQHRALNAEDSADYRENYVDKLLPTATEPLGQSFAQLTKNGSFMVFRKLQQHLPRFTDLVDGRDYLAQLLVGRNKQGELLAEDQLTGSSGCPFARTISHIDRCNPRTRLSRSGADSRAVDQHRIIRRGIPYGDPDSGADDYGLLFVCYNSRIDTQFEFVQREWINKADTFGEYNDVRDPIAQSNNQPSYFYWHEADASLQRTKHHGLVTLRGGDYYFVPGRDALQRIADEGLESFTVNQAASQPSMSGSNEIAHARIWQTLPKLLEHPGAPYLAEQFNPMEAAESLDVRGLTALAAVEQRQIVHPQPQQQETLYYLTQPEHIDAVLSQPDVFTTEDYAQRIRVLSGSWMLLGESPCPQREARREFMRDALTNAHIAYQSKLPQWLKTLLMTHGRDGVVDIVALCRELPLQIVSDYFGVQAPHTSELTEQHFEVLISDYFGRAQGQKVIPEIANQFPPALRTAKNAWCFWIRSVFVHVFLNLYNVSRIQEAALQSSRHLCQFIDKAVKNSDKAPDNSVLASLRNNAAFNDEDRRQVLLELIVGSVETTLKGLVSICESLLDDPSTRVKALQLLQSNADQSSWDLLVRSILVRDPVASISFRKCPMGTQLQGAGNLDIAADSWLYLVNEAATKVALTKGSANPFFDFGRESMHSCLGKEVALAEMRELLKVLVQLKDMRRVAGPRGQLSKHWQLPQHLYIRFDASCLSEIFPD